MFRVQKTLLAEYEEIYEPVLVENPFTLVDTRGIGLRQYHVALTPSRIIFGCDNFYKHGQRDNVASCYGNCLDPEIECFELVSLIPLQLIRFNFYRHLDRCLMMVSVSHQLQLTAPLSQERPMILEFGGHVFQTYFWRTWRERVSTIRLMQPLYSQITGHSPFSSTDVMVDDEETAALVHKAPRTPSVISRCQAGC
ncbi:uncharacterized protein LOC117580448 [Drosophila guanche]|uniref:Uncharacterized protein n=1 Tax=Drosophila guanche TaxID=7266 RepID=A0A3B0J540_DROGU|nr:uncharacterized protein LOC117580448 [Drosophila guanche]SPP74783.1 Hypothetical predicted protein [Drosophila guanche]